MKTSKKVLMTLVVVGLAGSLIATAVFSAFSATTDSTGNTFQAGTVSIGDNDTGLALYNFTNQTPSSPAVPKCIQVTYTGSLDSAVKLYTGSTIDPSGQYINLKITPGTGGGAFPSCTGFTPDAGGALYDGTLSAFATAHSSWTNGLALNNALGSATWLTNNAVTYKFELSVQNVAAAQGAQSGTHTWTWESQA